MSRPVVITVAITGSARRKADNPAVPLAPNEQIESTHEAWEAGAALVHLHARNTDGSPSSDPDRFGQVMEGVHKHCPGMIIQFSTGSATGANLNERGGALRLRPDMASLTTGSVNLAERLYENVPQLVRGLAQKMQQNDVKPEVEVFDLSMIHAARELVDLGLMTLPAHVQFIIGNRNPLPARQEILEFLTAELERTLPGATWSISGLSPDNPDIADWALKLGGHLRTGFEDTIHRPDGQLAKNNADLVAVLAEACKRHSSRPATPEEARRILSLPYTKGP